LKLGHHKASGQAYVTLPGLPKSKVVYLDVWGFEESETDYKRVFAEWNARGRTAPAKKTDDGLMINEMLVKFLEWADSYNDPKYG